MKPSPGRRTIGAARVFQSAPTAVVLLALSAKDFVTCYLEIAPIALPPKVPELGHPDVDAETGHVLRGIKSLGALGGPIPR